MLQRLPWRFILLTATISWGLWALIALTGLNINENLETGLIYVVGGFGPSLAGIILLYRRQTTAVQREFWQRVTDFQRIQPRWYIIILLLYPVTLLMSYGIVAVFTGESPDFSGLTDLTQQPALAIITAFSILIIGPVSEEPGWRGYALDALQENFSPAVASIILGIIWWAWHLPLLLVTGSFLNISGASPVFLAGYLGTVLLYSILFTWVYNNNQRSVLATILMHFSINLTSGILAPPMPVFMVETFLLIGVVLLIFWRDRSFLSASIQTEAGV